jgi:hypothetical protein
MENNNNEIKTIISASKNEVWENDMIYDIWKVEAS